jgi:peptidoglycan/xylan/chitin deacetylase (PgdA/CDA1 family)
MIKKWLDKIKYAFEHKVIVLMYHRIANIESDPWSLAVSPENFEQQLMILKNEFNVISVTELLDQLKNKRIIKNSICLTFDDAYVDNYLFAKPLLEKYKCPATFFVATQYIDQQIQFWWDELEDIIFNSIKLPSKLSIYINRELFLFECRKDTLSNDELQKQRLWVYYEAPPTERCELYLELWKRLKQLCHSELMSSLRQIKDWAGYTAIKKDDSMAMTLQQLRVLIKEPLFEAGIHTSAHLALASHAKDVQKPEILNCKEYLKKNLYTYLDVIAYPYGNYNDITIAILKEQNIAAAMTTEQKIITKHSNRYKLGRFQVNNINGEKFKKQIIEWYP